MAVAKIPGLGAKIPGLGFGQCLLVSLGAWSLWEITSSPVARLFALSGVVASIFVALMLHFTDKDGQL
jgi:hypothetical protein